MEKSRREFIKKSTLFTTGISLATGSAWTKSFFAANEKVNVGLIGCRNQGFSVLNALLQTGQVNCLGLCDIDQTVLDGRFAEVEKKYQQTPRRYGDFRHILEDKEIDAVIIGTPDHWHCLQAIYACQAGKDVYVEKPLANSIEECNKMVEAAQKYGRVVQVGQQQRSGVVWQGVMDYIKAGCLGTLRKVNVWANFNYGAGAKKQQDQAVPEGVDFDFWLGPAPERNFNPSRFHGNWRHFWDYGGGLMTDWGVHLIDMALWAKDITSAPKEVLAYGENLSYKDHDRETFDTMSVVYPMEDYVINWQHTGGVQSGPYDMPYGVEFIGDRTTIVADRSGWTVRLEDKQDNMQAMAEAEKYRKASGLNDMGNHVRNFIDCIKSRERTNCPIETGRNVALYAHMGNIAARSGAGRLIWDEASQTFGSNREANDLIMPAYRKQWELSHI